jgi:hypothetical protein
MRDLRAARLLLLAFGLVACHEEGRDNGSSSGSTGPDFTVCAACADAGACPQGQVCASITPASGGVCMLACSDGEPEPCVFDGIVTGTCETFSPNETRACSSLDNGPVCPPS